MFFFGDAYHIEPELPQVECILDFSVHGASPWASTFRIDTQHRDGHEHSYFLKVNSSRRYRVPPVNIAIGLMQISDIDRLPRT